MIKGHIVLSKIDKERIFINKKGEKCLNITHLETPNDKYGNDYMIIEDVSKEERESGVKGTILGNGKIFGANRPSSSPAENSPVVSSDDLPF